MSHQLRITARHSAKDLDVKDYSKENLAPIIQWGWHGTNNQRWLIEGRGDGTVRIRSLESLKVLDVLHGSMAPNQPVIQYEAGEDPVRYRHQHWRIEYVRDGAVRLIAAHSGLALSVAGGSRNDGATIVQFPWNDLEHQLFYIGLVT